MPSPPTPSAILTCSHTSPRLKLQMFCPGMGAGHPILMPHTVWDSTRTMLCSNWPPSKDQTRNMSNVAIFYPPPPPKKNVGKEVWSEHIWETCPLLLEAMKLNQENCNSSSRPSPTQLLLNSHPTSLKLSIPPRKSLQRSFTYSRA